ncbi:MAG TPA: hypothetical protein DC064_17110 [Cyanobacteria bacterium UBA9273]|nr:hypothetical protein [Cyanobacteria bacterium UBA9273]
MVKQAGFSPITNHQSPITHHQSPITNYQSPITNYQLSNKLNRCLHNYRNQRHSSITLSGIWELILVPRVFQLFSSTK